MNPIDFASEPRWHDAFCNTKDTVILRRFLRDHPNDFVSLYHGTSKQHPIMTQGLLPTSTGRKKSMQSGIGYVYLSVYPGMAFDFGRIAYPGHEIVVYKVTTIIRRLKADLDQLRNQRHFAERNVGNTLAESLIFGSGARIKGKIEPMSLSLFTGHSRQQ